jgi:hypothetical protein
MPRNALSKAIALHLSSNYPRYLTQPNAGQHKKAENVIIRPIPDTNVILYLDLYVDIFFVVWQSIIAWHLMVDVVVGCQL